MKYEKIPDTQKGSNPGGIFMDNAGGKHYIKFPKDLEQAKVEVATANIYHKLGIKTLNPELEHSVGHTTGVRTKWDSSANRMHEDDIKSKTETDPEFRKGILNLYHAAALTNNWDVIGLEKDNILHSPEHGLVSVDQGGSMGFRAQGEPKPFEHDAKPELVSLLHPRRPAGEVFGHAFKHASKEEIDSSKASLNRLTNEDIDNIIKASGLSQNHAETIKARRDSILKG